MKTLKEKDEKILQLNKEVYDLKVQVGKKDAVAKDLEANLTSESGQAQQLQDQITKLKTDLQTSTEQYEKEIRALKADKTIFNH